MELSDCVRRECRNYNGAFHCIEWCHPRTVRYSHDLRPPVTSTAPPHSHRPHTRQFLSTIARGAQSTRSTPVHLTDGPTDLARVGSGRSGSDAAAGGAMKGALVGRSPLNRRGGKEGEREEEQAREKAEGERMEGQRRMRATRGAAGVNGRRLRREDEGRGPRDEGNSGSGRERRRGDKEVGVPALRRRSRRPLPPAVRAAVAAAAAVGTAAAAAAAAAAERPLAGRRPGRSCPRTR